MIKDKNIICISSIDWDFVWQGHQEIMSVLADNGNRVLFVENTGVRTPNLRDMPRLWNRFLNWKKGYKGIRKINDFLYIYSPIVLPFPYSKIATKINRFIMLSVIRKWMKVFEFRNPVVWSFLPTPLVVDMLNELSPSIFIYYCIDDFASSSREARKIKKVEEKVIKSADLVFTTSRRLFEKCRAINEKTYSFPFGVSVENYDVARENTLETPDDMKSIKGPIIGYIGGIHKWIDFKLLSRIALENKEISFVLIGPKQADLSLIENIKNIYLLGKKDMRQLPRYVKLFNAGIIPYLKTAYTENVYPTKINEYLAMGKPVISTKIPEVAEFAKQHAPGLIYFLEDYADFNLLVRDISKEDCKVLIDKRVEAANNNSWKAKIEKMCLLIRERLEEIRSSMEHNWMKNFRQFCIQSNRKIVKIAGFILLTYVVIFYSPLIWFVARPLAISEAPEKSDAIVVFGGGVGEGGSPGKSTIERSRFSVSLYDNDYADSIVYSSGYRYKYNDAENMKMFAISMGVPNQSIILERKAGSAYENVKYTCEILKRMNMDEIILVSSLYNMRRVSLVFNHMAGDIKVHYVPVPNAQFYHRSIPVKLEQIKAIIHEYASIVYYYFKGYI